MGYKEGWGRGGWLQSYEGGGQGRPYLKGNMKAKS